MWKCFSSSTYILLARLNRPTRLLPFRHFLFEALSPFSEFSLGPFIFSATVFYWEFLFFPFFFYFRFLVWGDDRYDYVSVDYNGLSENNNNVLLSRGIGAVSETLPTWRRAPTWKYETKSATATALHR